MAIPNENHVDSAVLAARLAEGSTSLVVGPAGAQESVTAGLATANFRDDLGPAAQLDRAGPAFNIASAESETPAAPAEKFDMRLV